MRFAPSHFLPLALPFFLALMLLATIVIGLIEVRVLSYTYARIGIKRRYIFLTLAASLLGSAVELSSFPRPQDSPCQLSWDRTRIGVSTPLAGVLRPPSAMPAQ
jgi:hypothetical protein